MAVSCIAGVIAAPVQQQETVPQDGKDLQAAEGHLGVYGGYGGHGYGAGHGAGYGTVYGGHIAGHGGA